MAEANCPACERPSAARINGYCPSCWVAGRDEDVEAKEQAAARAREADEILRAVATIEPVSYHDWIESIQTYGYWCAMCQQAAKKAGTVPHAADCPWLRVRAYVGAR